jgi:hypothetical protein
MIPPARVSVSFVDSFSLKRFQGVRGELGYPKSDGIATELRDVSCLVKKMSQSIN